MAKALAYPIGILKSTLFFKLLQSQNVFNVECAVTFQLMKCILKYLL